MSKNENNHNSGDGAPRVYKSASVHKRRGKSPNAKQVVVASDAATEAMPAVVSEGASSNVPQAEVEERWSPGFGGEAKAGAQPGQGGRAKAGAQPGQDGRAKAGAQASPNAKKNANAESISDAGIASGDSVAIATREDDECVEKAEGASKTGDSYKTGGPGQTESSGKTGNISQLGDADRAGDTGENANQDGGVKGAGQNGSAKGAAIEGEAAEAGGAEESELESGSGEGDAEKTAAQHAKPKKRRWVRVLGVVAVVIVAGLLVLAGYIGGSRWVRFNDEADIQGRWFVYGTDVPVRFENGSIVLNDETSYAYSIDSTAKTMEYTFGNLAGQGRYWFNAERDTLVITDGAHYTMWSTLLDDVSFEFNRLFGKGELPTSDTSIVLTRSVVQGSADVATPDASGSSASASASSSSGSGAAASEAASSSGESGGDSNRESADNLQVSDIMMDDAAEGTEGQREL